MRAGDLGTCFDGQKNGLVILNYYAIGCSRHDEKKRAAADKLLRMKWTVSSWEINT